MNKSYCLGVVFILEKDSRELKSIENKSQNEDISSCIYARIQLFQWIKGIIKLKCYGFLDMNLQEPEYAIP